MENQDNEDRVRSKTLTDPRAGSKTPGSVTPGSVTPGSVTLTDPTDPGLIRRTTDITSESLELEPGERAEIILCPERAMRSPILRMSSSCRDDRILVEEVVHGRAPIFREAREVENFHRGLLTNLTVTASEPVKIIIVNTSDKSTIVSASLVESGTPTPELLPIRRPKTDPAVTIYRLRNLQSEELNPRSIRPEKFPQPDGPRPADKKSKE